VFAFHLDAQWLKGGFVGVDVFFVISGYLITGILLTELEAGKFDLVNFAMRRIQRILPVLMVVVAATVTVWLIAFAPSQFSGSDASAVWAILGLANLHYWAEASYFATSAYDRPLLHTWSLGVEEQFYLVWPFAFWLLVRMSGKKKLQLAVAMGGLSFFGLVAAEIAVRRAPDAAFYLSHLRAWEFGCGATVAVLGPVNWIGARGAQAIRMTGLILIVGTAVWLDRTSSFPGLSALAPCIGAAMLLARTSYPTSTSALLSLPLFKQVGVISYSLYLWHWPAILFLTAWIGPRTNHAEIAALSIVICGTLAYPRFLHVGLRQQMVRYRTGPPRRDDACKLPMHMPKAGRDLRPRRLWNFLDPAKAQRIGVIMDAQFRGLIAVCPKHMHPCHTFAARQFSQESRGAGVCGVRHFRQQKRAVEFEGGASCQSRFTDVHSVNSFSAPETASATIVVSNCDPAGRCQAFRRMFPERSVVPARVL
jgi:peptidoglycan/LPS O-acetylase OafA/YrhL